MVQLKTIFPGQTATQEVNHSDFETLYLHIREKEKRIYTDEQVTRLPQISPQHPHYKEWLMREQSCNKLLQYLKKKECRLDILEVGCGNGWLSAKIAGVIQGTVTGIDINNTELDQAKRVFGEKDNLHFISNATSSNFLEDKFFDIIIFAASVQYFPSINNLLETTLDRLRLHGEIHIIDSHFYKRPELTSAKQRTRDYYETIGNPEMTAFYFHHCLDELDRFNYKILYNPNSYSSRLWKNKNSFYWIKILQY